MIAEKVIFMDASLISDIKSLPQSMQEEVKDFVGYLKSKLANKKTFETESKREFGAFKGKIKMSEDFDEPLEDFKEYME